VEPAARGGLLARGPPHTPPGWVVGAVGRWSSSPNTATLSPGSGPTLRDLAAFVFVVSSATAQEYFADIRKASFPLVDTDTLGVFAADVDADGRLDLVLGSVSTTWYPSRTPLVDWNRGHGRFAAGQESRGLEQVPMGVADLDGDGDGDLVAPGGAWRYDGQERFTFLITAWSGAPGWTSNDRFAIGDVDRDGLPDVCTGHDQGRLWLNRGGFAFVAASVQVPAAMRGNPILADVDGDGDLDLLTFASQTYEPAQLARNDGTGHFVLVPHAAFPAPFADVRDVACADFDGDRLLDVVLVGPQRPTLLRNGGAAGFADETFRLSSWLPAHAVAAGDVDGDGDVDLVFGGSVHANTRGSFVPVPDAWRPVPGPVQGLVLFDGDQDGDLDLVETRAQGWDGASGYGMANHVAWNDGGGRFRQGVVPPIPLTVTGGAALGDLDGDGHLDLLCGGGGVQVLRGDGRGGFAAPLLRQLPVRGKPELGDLDGDGDLDAVLVEALAFHVLHNPGDGLLRASTSIFYSGLAAGSGGTDGVLGDFDGDGALDLLVVTVGRGRPPYYFAPEVDLLYRGDGRGGFAAVPTALPVGSASFDVTAGDLDGDGRLDAVTDGGAVYRNTPARLVAESYRNPEYAGFTRAQLADMDGDGHLDLVCGNGCQSFGLFSSCDRFTNSPPKTVLWNDGRGNLGGAEPLRSVLPTYFGNTRAVAVGDVDDDGDLDVVLGDIAEPNSPWDDLVLNDGARSFRNASWQPPFAALPEDTGDTRDLFLADLDHDGDLDLVAIDDSPGDSGYPASRVYVNLTRHLRTLDLARLGLPYRMHLDGAPGGAVLLLASGPGSLATPFGRFGLELASAIVAGTFGPPLQGRRLVLEPTVPAEPSLLDATLWWQAGVVDRGTLRFTNVVADRIGR